MRPFILVALGMCLFLLSGCQGSGGGSSSGGGSGEPSSGEAGTGGTGAAFPPPPVQQDIPREGDFQVIFFQTNGAQTMVIANAGHTLRASDEGRRRLALNIPGGGYKVLSEKAMKALLTSLDDRGYGQLATPFRRGDERWFEPQGDPRYRGMIFVDRNGKREKLLGFRAAGANDGVGQQRYKAFVELKLLFLNWYQATSETEQPDSGRIGGGGRGR